MRREFFGNTLGSEADFTLDGRSIQVRAGVRIEHNDSVDGVSVSVHRRHGKDAHFLREREILVSKFHFIRVHVLSGGGDDEILGPSGKKEVSVGVAPA